MKTSYVPAVNMGRVERKLKAISKRAEKLGIDFQYEVGQSEVRKVSVYLPNGQVDLLNSPAFVTCYPVTCSDMVVKIDGFYIDGKLEKIDGVNIVYGNVPVGYREIENFHCEHCNTSRPSKHLYFVTNNGTGETKAVGSGCLEDYTDNTNASDYAGFFQSIQLLDEIMCEPSWGGQSKEYILLEKFFYCVMVSFGQSGFVKSSEQNSTKSNALEMYEDANPTDEQLKSAKENIEIILNYLENKRPLNNFEFDVYQYLSMVYDADELYSRLNVRMAGIISASILLVEKANSFEISGEFVHNVGERIQDELTFVNKKYLCATDYGNMYIYKFVDANNNVFCWFTGDKDNWENGVLVKKFEEGETYKVKFTIKEHSVYGSEKQNVVSRVSVVK